MEEMQLGGVWNAYPESPDEVYERYLVPAIFRPWAEALIGVAAPQPGERVLDVACGTGVVATLAKERVGAAGHVVGLDVSAGMLAVARTRGAAIEWRQASAQAMPFADGSFDLILCQHGLQFFPDRLAGLREMRRVLAPTGRAAINVFGPVERSAPYAAMSVALAKRVGEEAARLPQFALGDAAALRDMVASAGFRAVRVQGVELTLHFPTPQDFVQQISAGGVAMRRVMAQLPPEERGALLDEVATAMRPYCGAGGFDFPQLCNLVTATT